MVYVLMQCTGFIETDMTGALSDEVRKEWANRYHCAARYCPRGRCSYVFRFDISTYVSGTVINVCGGMGSSSIQAYICLRFVLYICFNSKVGENSRDVIDNCILFCERLLYLYNATEFYT